MFVEVFIGLLAGMSSGLLGIGGAFVLIPLFIALLHTPLHVAIGTSLALTLVSVSSGALYHIRNNQFDFHLAAAIFIPGILFSALGAYVSNYVAARVLVFVLLLVIFTAALIGKPGHVPVLFQSRFVEVLCGMVIGFLSGLLGIGGGVILVPFFLLIGIAPHKAVGTSLLTILFMGIGGTLVHALNGNVSLTLFIPVAVGTVIGALGASRIGLRLSNEKLQFLLRVAFFTMGMLLLYTEFLEGFF